MKIRSIAAVAAVVLVAVGGFAAVGVTPAGAAVKPPVLPPNSAPPGTASTASTAPVKSPFGAGYLSEPDGFASASSTFLIPTVTCASGTGMEALFLGVHAYGGSGLVAYAVASPQCLNGTLAYYIIASTPGQSNFLQVTAGDKVVTSLWETATATRAVVRDVTKHTGTTATGSTAAIDSVLVGDRGVATVPTFTTVTLHVCQVNGLSLAQATPLTHEMLKTSALVQIGASGFANADSDSFKLTFKSNS